MQLFKDIVPQFLHMDKRVQVKLIRWLAKSNCLPETYIKVMKDKELYQEQFNNYGRK
jgi:hypothetical protein